jgi:hypothetical protein
MDNASYRRIAAICGPVAAASILLFTVAAVLRPGPVTVGLGGACLMVAGFASSVLMMGLAHRLEGVNSAFLNWALLIAVIAAVAAMAHGGYRLGLALHPPPIPPPDVPNQLDPRGILTFGLGGVSILAMTRVLQRLQHTPGVLSLAGYLSGVVLIAVYAGRLFIVYPKSGLIAVPAVLAGLVLLPAWYSWLGLLVWPGRIAPGSRHTI